MPGRADPGGARDALGALGARLPPGLPAPVRATPVAGGDINEAYAVELADGARVFVKTHAAPPAGMYAAEAAGLAWLGAGPLRVPRVVAVGERALVLGWLDLAPAGAGAAAASLEALGRGLARLHGLGAPAFGHAAPSFLATLPQDNAPAPDAATHYVERRLRPLLARLAAQGGPDLRGGLDALRARADAFGPPERPARLHGDLWWGNVALDAATGAPVLIDPAVYGGHRETDLAMLALFGGVPARLVAAYEEVAPLAPGWRARVALWQLYPLAAHAVLFGGGYVGQVARGLADLTR